MHAVSFSTFENPLTLIQNRNYNAFLNRRSGVSHRQRPDPNTPQLHISRHQPDIRPIIRQCLRRSRRDSPLPRSAPFPPSPIPIPIPIFTSLLTLKPSPRNHPHPQQHPPPQRNLHRHHSRYDRKPQLPNPGRPRLVPTRRHLLLRRHRQRKHERPSPLRRPFIRRPRLPRPPLHPTARLHHPVQFPLQRHLPRRVQREPGGGGFPLPAARGQLVRAREQLFGAELHGVLRLWVWGEHGVRVGDARAVGEEDGGGVCQWGCGEVLKVMIAGGEV